jgi:hypothetical protein
MGYRSDVVLAVKKQYYDLALENPLLKEVLVKWSGSTNSSGDWIVVQWNWVKWYENYPEIEAFNDWLNHIEELDAVASKVQDTEVIEPFKFCRIGEDSDDNEERGNYEIDVFISRSIQIGLGFDDE